MIDLLVMQCIFMHFELAALTSYDAASMLFLLPHRKL